MKVRAWSAGTLSSGFATHRGRSHLCTGLALALVMVLLLPSVCIADPWDVTPGPPHEYDPVNGGRNCILAGIDATHYLCLHRGTGGQAVILKVDPVDWTLSTVTTYQYDENGDYMGLAAIDPSHFLCTYCGEDEAAYASVLSVDPGTWAIATQSTLPYDPEFGYYNALSPIDATHYLGVHNMWDVTGRAGVFTVDPQMWAITYGSECAFEPESGFDFKLTRIDATHHLCLYPSQAGGYFGRAVVLVVDPQDWTVSTAHPPVTYASDCDAYAFVSRIDAEHFLCAYQGPGSHGWAVVLTVDPVDWSISLETPFEYDPALGGEPNLTRIDATHHLCAYKGEGADGYAVVLTVDPADWSISNETPCEWDADRADYPYLCPIAAGHYLCSYEGPGSDGWALVLRVELAGAGVPDGYVERAGMISGRPNPSRGLMTIDYYLAAGGRAELAITDAGGRIVSTLLEGWLPSGAGSVRWDGRDGHGSWVGPGIYFCTLQSGDRREVAKLITLR
jgi:hypothetical protein